MGEGVGKSMGERECVMKGVQRARATLGGRVTAAFAHSGAGGKEGHSCVCGPEDSDKLHDASAATQQIKGQ